MTQFKTRNFTFFAPRTVIFEIKYPFRVRTIVLLRDGCPGSKKEGFIACGGSEVIAYLDREVAVVEFRLFAPLLLDGHVHQPEVVGDTYIVVLLDRDTGSERQPEVETFHAVVLLAVRRLPEEGGLVAVAVAFGIAVLIFAVAAQSECDVGADVHLHVHRPAHIRTERRQNRNLQVHRFVFRGCLFAVAFLTVGIGLLGAARREQKTRLYVESVGDRNVHDAADVEARPGVEIEFVIGIRAVLAADVRDVETRTDSVRDFALLVRAEHVAERLGGGRRNARQEHCGQHEAFLHSEREFGVHPGPGGVII